MDGQAAMPHVEGSPRDLDALHDHLASTYPDAFTGLSVRGGDSVDVRRVPARGLDEAAVRVRFGDIRLRFRDAVRTKVEADGLMAQVANDMLTWQARGVAVRLVTKRRDGRVEIGVDGPVDQAREAMREQYGEDVVVVPDEGVDDR